jgi:hypothetical protein
MNEEIMKAAGFGKEVEAVHSGNCPTCRKPINMNDFKDMLSRKEFRISGMCQECQDGVFE